MRLSGGQRQRLAIARAFLADARLVILDEATSHLDARARRVIRDSSGGWPRGRTVLVVSHRLRLVAVADRVVVLDGGRVVESGPSGRAGRPRRSRIAGSWRRGGDDAGSTPRDGRSPASSR